MSTLAAADHDVVRSVECRWLDPAVETDAYYLPELIDAATQVEAVPAGCHRRHTTRFF